MTTILAASTGIVQNDLKRVIAYSTCSQLGYMVFVCGLSGYGIGVFHLMNHAFFKALLFLSAGSIIHALGDEQDLRKLGAVAQLLPYTYGMVIIGSLALTGFPFLAGFYSKDVILEIAYAKYTVEGNFVYLLGSASVFFTSYYSFRLLYLGFLGPASFFKPKAEAIHDAPFLLGVPLVPLAFGSLFVGYRLREAMIGFGAGFWGNALLVLPEHGLLLESEYIPQEVKHLPFVIIVLGGLVAYFINLGAPHLTYALKTSALGRRLYIFLNKRWLFDKVYNDYIAYAFLGFGYHYSFKLLDKGFIEILGPYGITKTILEFQNQTRSVQTGFVYHYAVIMLLGVIIFLSFQGLLPFLLYWIDPRLTPVFGLSFLFVTSKFY
jgi:NADH-ubiquinone oxidoreductase chain 5